MNITIKSITTETTQNRKIRNIHLPNIFNTERKHDNNKRARKSYIKACNNPIA